MALPAEKQAQRVSMVASCGARECVHNERGDCHAGSIRVEMGDEGPVCATYEPEGGPRR